MAEAMGRVGYGIELTAKYARLYEHIAESAQRFLTRIEEDSFRRDNFRETIIQLRLLKFASLLGKQIKEAGLAISWVRANEGHRRPRQDHHVTSARFDLVLDEDSAHEAVLTAARAAIERPPLSKFGIDATLVPISLGDSSTDGYWYPSGRFWNPPDTERPSDCGPHVVAQFRPDPDRIDDIPYG